MKKRISNKNLSLTIFIITMCCIIIGYAALSNRNLIMNGNASITGVTSESDFNVIFTGDIETTKTDNYISISTPTPSNRNASFSVSNMRGFGDEVTIKYKIKNMSEYHTANFNVSLTNTNSTYFSVTKALKASNNALQETNSLDPQEETYLFITGRIIEIPTASAQSTTVTVTITAQSTPYEGGAA